MEIEFEIQKLEDLNVGNNACWGHCCTHSGYGNDDW